MARNGRVMASSYGKSFSSHKRVPHATKKPSPVAKPYPQSKIINQKSTIPHFPYRKPCFLPTPPLSPLSELFRIDTPAKQNSLELSRLFCFTHLRNFVQVVAGQTLRTRHTTSAPPGRELAGSPGGKGCAVHRTRDTSIPCPRRRASR